MTESQTKNKEGNTFKGFPLSKRLSILQSIPWNSDLWNMMIIYEKIVATEHSKVSNSCIGKQKTNNI
jgi:hypothetical protein